MRWRRSSRSRRAWPAPPRHSPGSNERSSRACRSRAARGPSGVVAGCDRGPRSTGGRTPDQARRARGRGGGAPGGMGGAGRATAHDLPGAGGCASAGRSIRRRIGRPRNSTAMLRSRRDEIERLLWHPIPPVTVDPDTLARLETVANAPDRRPRRCEHLETLRTRQADLRSQAAEAGRTAGRRPGASTTCMPRRHRCQGAPRCDGSRAGRVAGAS
jgi:hypothetical protein